MINFNTLMTPSIKQEHLSSNTVHAKKLLFLQFVLTIFLQVLKWAVLKQHTF